MSATEESLDDKNSRFFSVLQLNGPITPLNVNDLRTSKEDWDQEGAVMLMRSIYYEEACRKFLVCLAGNISKPLRPVGECVEGNRIEELKQERDQLAREHYDQRKRNVRSSAIYDSFQQFFHKTQDQQTRAAAEIIRFVEKLRDDHRLKKEAKTKEMENVKSRLDSQREYTMKLTDELKALTRDVRNLEQKDNEMDLSLLNEKIRYAVRGVGDSDA